MFDNQSEEKNAQETAKLSDDELEQVAGGKHSRFDGHPCKCCGSTATYTTFERYFPHGFIAKVKCRRCGGETQIDS